jgi:hypothetical protein
MSNVEMQPLSYNKIKVKLQKSERFDSAVLLSFNEIQDICRVTPIFLDLYP